jgi:hypothetical protein
MPRKDSHDDADKRSSGGNDIPFGDFNMRVIDHGNNRIELQLATDNCGDIDSLFYSAKHFAQMLNNALACNDMQIHPPVLQKKELNGIPTAIAILEAVPDPKAPEHEPDHMQQIVQRALVAVKQEVDAGKSPPDAADFIADGIRKGDYALPELMPEQIPAQPQPLVNLPEVYYGIKGLKSKVPPAGLN